VDSSIENFPCVRVKHSSGIGVDARRRHIWLALIGVGVAVAAFIGQAAAGWTPRAPMSVPRYAHAAAELGGKIHVVGGTSFQSCNFLNSHAVYDPSTNSWASAASMSVPRVHPGAAVVDGLLYVVGGTITCSSDLATVEAYDPVANSWTPRASMSTPRALFGTAVVNGRILAIGGNYPSGIGGMLSSAESYDPVSNLWSPLPSLPKPLYGMAVGVVDGIVYIAGGGTTGGVVSNQVYAFDPSHPGAEWVTKAPLPVAPGHLDAAVVNGRLYVMGGHSTTVQVYDPASNVWSTAPSLPTARTEMTPVAVGDQLYAIGGLVNPGTILADNLRLSAPPVTTATVSPDRNGNGWNNGNVHVALSATASQSATVASITYALSGAQSGGATVAGDSAALTVSAEGTTTVTYHAQDSLGNVEPPHAVTVRIDRTLPLINEIEDQTLFAESPDGASFEFTPTASDAGGSGVASVSSSHPDPLFPIGQTEVILNALDNAGNGAVPVSFTVNVITLVSLEVTPREATIMPGETQQFIGVAHFSDGSTRTTADNGDGGGGGDGGGDNGGSGGGGGRGGNPPGAPPTLWSIEFSPSLSLAPCGVGGGNAYSSQAFGSDAVTGAVDVTWSPGTPQIRAVGTLVRESHFDATLSCANGTPVSGQIRATWNGGAATRFLGSYTLGANTGKVAIKGWSSKAGMPQPRFSLAAAEAGGKVYTFGGAAPAQVFNRTDVFDPATNTWSPLAAMPAAREGIAAATLGGRIYVAGGNAGGSAHATVDVFDPSTGTWDSSPADLLHARAHFALVSTGTALYAIGGDTGPNFTGVMASVERYDPGSNTWTEVAPLPEPRAFLTAGALNSGAMIIAAGGGSIGGNPSATPYVYDVPTGTWRNGPQMLSTAGPAGGAVIGNGFYLWSSTGLCFESGQVFVPEIVTPMTTRPEGWAFLAVMPTRRGQFGIAAVGDVIYAAGGQLPGQATPVDTVESYSANAWNNFQTQSGTGQSPCGSGGGGGGGGEGEGGGGDGPTWRVLDESIASIDANGLATALSPGTTTVVVEFAGFSCLDTNDCATLTVGDLVPPTITSATPSVASLWPANHRMVGVSVAVTATDNIDPAPVCSITSVSSNEPASGLGDGDVANDWSITGALTLNLRAERGGRTAGRDYTIDVTCADASGNSATTSVHVLVPRDQRK
jgi:N-acetylneuraminic acid mutarotase